MSYILDALRRADSERERGAVPGLHAQPVPSVSDEPAARAPRPWLWAVLGLVLGLLAAFAWFATRSDAPPPSPPMTPPMTPPTPPPADAGPPPQARMAPPAAGETPPPAPPEAPAPTVTFPPQAPPVARSESARPAPHKASAAAPAMPATATAKAPAATASTPAAPPATTAAAASAPDVVAYKDLPESVRRELPPLAIGGSAYSDVAANRFVLINGNVFHEKDTLAPQLVLEQIRARSAVLRYKTWRYEITF